MFKSIYDAFSICLEGTIFQRRHKKNYNRRYASALFSDPLAGETAPPYVLTQDEYRIKNDVITKYHCADNWMCDYRDVDRWARSRWLPDHYEQVYDPPMGPQPNPQVELYYQALGLGLARDPHTIIH